MQVGKVNSVNSAMHFNGQRASKKNEAQVYYVRNENVLKFGLAGLVVIGTTAVANSILKKNNHSIPELLGKFFNNISKKITQNKKDPLISILKEKRDANAVQLYKKYQAKSKIKSFGEKFLAGEYKNKPANVYNYMSKNIEELSRTVSCVI